MSGQEPFQSLEDKLEQNILKPFAGAKTIERWVYAVFLEQDILNYEAIRKAAQMTAYKKDCHLVRVQRDLPENILKALWKGTLPKQEFIKYLKDGKFNVRQLHTAPKYGIQLGPIPNYQSKDPITAPPIDIALETRLAGMTGEAVQTLGTSDAANKFLALLQKARPKQEPKYLRLHRELYPKHFLDPGHIEDFVPEFQEIQIFFPRQAAMHALARGKRPDEIEVEIDGKVQSPFTVVKDRKEIIHPFLTRRAGLLIKPEGDDLLGEGGMGIVRKRINGTGRRIVPPEDEIDESADQNTIVLSDFSYVAVKAPTDDIKESFRDIGIQIWRTEGENAKQLRHLPHTIREVLEDNTDIPNHPEPILLVSELLYGEITEFLSKCRLKYEKDPRFGPDKPYTADDAAFLAAIDHSYRPLVAFASVNRSHGDIKPDNLCVSRRREHDFEKFLEDTKRPHTIRPDPRLIDSAILDYVKKPVFYDEGFVCLMDLQSLRAENSPIEDMNIKPMYTPPYVDLKWFAMGGNSNHYTDMYALGQTFVNLLESQIKQGLEKSAGLAGLEESIAEFETHDMVFHNHMFGGYRDISPDVPMNIATAYRHFLTMAYNNDVKPPFNTLIDQNDYEHLSIPWSPQTQAEYEQTVEQVLLNVQYRNKMWPYMTQKMRDRGIITIHPDIIRAVGSMIEDPYKRECLDPETPKERQVVPEVLLRFREYLDS